ncbi:MAG: amidohydrolase family protein [Pseudomonadota bacterium]
MPQARLFDTHAHFFTSDTDRYPIDVSGAREGEAAVRARIAANPATPASLIPLWDRLGVTGGAAVQYNTVYKTDNSYALAVGDAHPDRLSTVLILPAADPATPAMLRDLAGRHNVVGLRLFGYPDADGDYPWLDSPAALDTWQVANELGLRMVLMYAPGVPSAAAFGRIIALAKRFPSTVISLDHCGWTHVDRGDEGTIGAEHLSLLYVPNIRFKVTQINFNRFAEAGIDPARFVRRMVDTFGIDRVMWGSDYGNTKNSYEEMVEHAIAATSLLTDAERTKLLHDNGRALFANLD